MFLWDAILSHSINIKNISIYCINIYIAFLTFPDVFHWACAEAKYRALPRTTAPAGYQCPSCATPVFPPSNLVSPVADELREKLAGVNWARAGLGLPLVSTKYFLWQYLK